MSDCTGIAPSAKNDKAIGIPLLESLLDELESERYACGKDWRDIVTARSYLKAMRELRNQDYINMVSANARAERAEAAEKTFGEALQEIRDRDWVENALDPQWSADIARAAPATPESKEPQS